jgi:hypothetical protein
MDVDAIVDKAAAIGGGLVARFASMKRHTDATRAVVAALREVCGLVVALTSQQRGENEPVLQQLLKNLQDGDTLSREVLRGTSNGGDLSFMGKPLRTLLCFCRAGSNDNAVQSLADFLLATIADLAADAATKMSRLLDNLQGKLTQLHQEQAAMAQLGAAGAAGPARDVQQRTAAAAMDRILRGATADAGKLQGLFAHSPLRSQLPQWAAFHTELLACATRMGAAVALKASDPAWAATFGSGLRDVRELLRVTPPPMEAMRLGVIAYTGCDLPPWALPGGEPEPEPVAAPEPAPPPPAPAPAPPPPLPEGWLEYAADDGEPFYVNQWDESHTQWERPTAPAPRPAPQPAPRPPLPEGWEEFPDEDGDYYYSNMHTSETQWERPTAPAPRPAPPLPPPPPPPPPPVEQEEEEEEKEEEEEEEGEEAAAAKARRKLGVAADLVAAVLFLKKQQNKGAPAAPAASHSGGQPPPAAPEEDDEDGVDLEWSCVACGVENPLDLTTCGGCGVLHDAHVAKMRGPARVTTLRQRSFQEVFGKDGQVGVNVSAAEFVRGAQGQRIGVFLQGPAAPHSASLGPPPPPPPPPPVST